MEPYFACMSEFLLGFSNKAVLYENIPPTFDGSRPFYDLFALDTKFP